MCDDVKFLSLVEFRRVDKCKPKNVHQKHRLEWLAGHSADAIGSVFRDSSVRKPDEIMYAARVLIIVFLLLGVGFGGAVLLLFPWAKRKWMLRVKELKSIVL